MSDCDVVVVGGGPGGYVAALRAAQLGPEVICVDARARLGGTCLNVGCIPSKALLHSSERLSEAHHEFERHGICVGDLSLDLGAMMARKDEAVEKLTSGIDQLFEKHSVAHVRGRARLRGPGEVEVEAEDGETRRLRV